MAKKAKKHPMTDDRTEIYSVGTSGAKGGPAGSYIQELIVRGSGEPPIGRNSVTYSGRNTLLPEADH